MSRRTGRGWISMAVVALVATAVVFAGPVPRTDAPTRLRPDIVIPRRPTSLELDAPTRLRPDIVIPARPTALQRDVVTLRETYHLPALELCVIDVNGIVDVATDGVRKAGGTDAVTSKDLFHLGSMTKAMTATMLATLVQEGKLSWDMTMAQAFPAIASVMDSRYKNVTLEQLLTHTSGLADYTTDPEWASIPPFTGTPAQQRQAFARMLLTRPPIGPAGVYRYSNAGYAVAVAIAERVTGKTWEQLMQQRVFGPLKIRAAYGWPLLCGDDEPWGHRIKNGVVTPHNPSDHYRVPTVLAPAGDVSMSILDYSVFARLHLAGLENIDGSVLSAADIQRLHEPVLEYSCGWHEELIDGIPTSWHRGSCDTFDTFVLLQPSRDIGVIVFTNADGDNKAANALFAEMPKLAGLYARQ
ncbi:class A beta-lactamase-related serine hydrolase [Candidatus Cryosericum septentrionale]|uniref:Class A beta-lactamase-related serine hydrolase n=2 Tax=Candidatus Cryosericum septentrionale TaxID=2290913 RepID=A0A398DSM1_9BACT|nr:class A beta-lactamase-related serine hydrolase [Candidatus Cryosericum septentrionale]